MNGQLAGAGCGRNGNATAATPAAAVVIMTVVSSLSPPLLTSAFQLALSSAANSTM